MYAGTSFHRLSGRIIGAHQKIDRVARKHLERLLSAGQIFPDASRILQFEGRRGPDALKRKSPSQDEPWHFFDPFDENDTRLFVHIEEHYQHLVEQLREGNEERAAFEAAWLAHAIADGLTPAHHYPYEEKLKELRGGRPNNTRNSIKAKVVMPGENRRAKVRNNWRMWGPRGLLLSHTFFEFGVALLLAPLSLKDALPAKTDIKKFEKLGLRDYFHKAAKDIAIHDLYTSYHKWGWTPRLAWKVRHRLGPQVVKVVTLAWYAAAQEAHQK